MIKKILLGLAVLLLIVISYFVYGIYINPVSPRGTSEINKESISINVGYGRPFKKDRLIFGDSSEGALLPYGVYWRLGANFATTFETNSTVSFSGRLIDPGKYRMYAVPYEDHWKLTLNTESGAFGFNEPDYSKDVLSINVSAKKLTEPIEQLTIDFIEDSIGISMRIRWDYTLVIVPIDY
ncbi:MAG: hypothetical protein CMC79_02005 [Flavobacteriaceae bacterium]|nr:hypothetical protein [Flavobacteriaceae bacterium]|tara:strand:- start:5640 stop:6182 length:543 start_codon:yes stop_codon:yes gene_type:complete